MSAYVYVILVSDISKHDEDLLGLVFPKARIRIQNPYNIKLEDDGTVYGFYGIPKEDLLDAAENFYNSFNNNNKQISELKNIKVRVLKSVNHDTWIEVTDEAEHIKMEKIKLYNVICKLKSWK